MSNRGRPVTNSEIFAQAWFSKICNGARHLFYLFLLALLIRLLYLAEVGRSPFFYPPPGLDPSLYHEWARAIAEGKGMGKEVFHAMPFYPYWLGIIYRLASPGLFWAFFSQALLGALSVVLLYAIGTTLFGRPVGWLAALGGIFSGTLLFYDMILVPASVIHFLFVLTLFLLLRAVERQRLRDWMGASFCLGLVTFAHAGIFLLLPVLFFWIMNSLSGSLLKKMATFGILTLFVFLASGVIFVRNLWIARDPTFLTAHGGINFYIGNHPGGTGRFQSLFAKHTSSEELLEDSRREAEKTLGRPLRASEASRFWFRKGFAFIRTEPVAALRLLSKKFLLFWNGYEIPDVEDYTFFRSRFSVLRYLGIPFGWLAPWALLGFFVDFKNVRRHFLLYGFFLSQMAGILLLFVNSRYRAPLLFFILLFAAYGVFWFYRLFLEKRYRAVLLTSFLLLHLVLFTHVDIGSTSPELQHYNIGVALDLAGEHEAAIAEFEKALLLYPEDSTVLFAMGNAYFQKKEFTLAKSYYEKVLSLNPHHADTCFNLGLLAFHEGRLGEAESFLQKSASLKETKADVHYLLSFVYREKGLLQKADSSKKRALELGADPEEVEKDPRELFFQLENRRFR